ncbi:MULTISPECIES: lasso RiPP family leader peptide-containing protein [unclassified Alteromonas]|uniref:lasso RiPP family leader peptide-containing protein n=1 Tax=unclassified Alteromonas TaxID=2614992 RepID=UPI001C0A021E|nr:lasso RiPP family leader peptide-containing protein [Alteromonas sp. C1M14]MBU2977719.1 lasso RiPP family leader peptide-containing protein [Alteromonas sp. C1M14]
MKSAKNVAVESKQTYTKPELQKVGTLAELTEGFAGSIPDEQGGQTKRNPFQG